MPRLRYHDLFHFLWRVAICVLAVMFVQNAEPQTQTPPTPPAALSELIASAGVVEVAPAGANRWIPVGTNQWLHAGDRLRTGPDSRATIQLSDRSVIRVGPSTLLEIEQPSPPSQHAFQLHRGLLYFLDREKPADIQFRTPLTTGAIRGTEFLLAVAAADAETRLELVDGAVDLASGAGTTRVVTGQQAVVTPGAPAKVTAMLSLTGTMQWSFYYPAVLNPADLKLSADEKTLFSQSLANYAAGDLIAAATALTNPPASLTDAGKTYLAGLDLALGKVTEAEALLPATGEPATAVRELIAAVRGDAEVMSAAPSTSSGWLAKSYYLQAHGHLDAALNAARQATGLAPEFAFAWVRLAELELGFGHREKARVALARAQQLSPRNAEVFALDGFLALGENSFGAAKTRFNQALALDGSLPNAWLGRALAEAGLRQDEAARRDLQVAATLEPQRGLYHTYLGKAWSQTGADSLAQKDFALAEKLDPADPTPWLYSALHRFQTHEVNDAIKDLEHSVALNDNRNIFRSRLQLDQDRAARSADLSAIYSAAGMDEVSERAASRAVQESYSDFSGHLFLADSLAQQEDPQHFNLRLETARQSELLVANLLAPPGGGNLSQLLSQQDRLEYFDTRPIGLSTLSTYTSRGDFSEAATAFGSVDGFSYAFDGQYVTQNGDRANDQFQGQQYSVQVKQQVTPSDSIYLQAGYYRGESGDLAQHFSPTNVSLSLRTIEEQSPDLYVGETHEWSPGSHTLLLFSRLTDRLSLTNPSPSVLFMGQDGSEFYGVTADPYFKLRQQLDYTLYSGEVQQIWETDHHELIIGGRFQHGDVQSDSGLVRLFGAKTIQSDSSYMERLSGYGYYQWRPINQFRFTAGLSYDDLTYPKNADLPPLSTGEDSRSLLGPKVGFTAEPWAGAWVHGAWTRSLGGLFFDNSIRLEPAQVAGELSAFRSLISESVAGLVPGTRFDSWSLGFDQALPSHTYFGIEGEWLTSQGGREVGAFSNSIPFIPVPNSPTATSQNLDYRERDVSAYVNQLVGRDWAVGARYALSEARLQTTLPALANVPGVSALEQNQRAVLQHGQLYLLWNLPCGFFAGWSSDWYHQVNHGYSPALPTPDFWQHQVFAGYVFPHRRAELRFSVLNLADTGYALNPLNEQYGLTQGRTFTVTLRLNF
jgi:tetratricopeptide (TPR) repeat protein